MLTQDLMPCDKRPTAAGLRASVPGRIRPCSRYNRQISKIAETQCGATMLYLGVGALDG